ncbi:MAG: type II toxin-antitoxin system VapC family toxin [Gemmatimonadota bacterium]
MIVADTSGMLALFDAADQHHQALLSWYEVDPDGWVLPWAVLPELDYMLMRIDARAELAFVRDLADARYVIEWGEPRDLARARELCGRYRALQLGLVDAVVMAIAERLKADAIATLDLRHFGTVKLVTSPLLLPRDG